MNRAQFYPRLCISLVIVVVAASAPGASPPSVEFKCDTGAITVQIDGAPVATYYYRDDVITRPYFAHIHVPNGVQVTRRHPPVDGQDLMDHPTLHPGLWMSFGDLSGCDYWRLKARVRQVAFIEVPHGGSGRGTFAVRNEYLGKDDTSKIVCREIARFTFLTRPAGYLLLWDSTFSSDTDFYFGDQEEMGLGFRVATPIRASTKTVNSIPPGNGAIFDAQGRKNEQQVAGNTADWCDYSGTLNGKPIGMTIFCHPSNFRPSWLHAREYGLLVANPFARHAFRKGEPSKIVVKPGDNLRLRYGVLLHSAPLERPPDFAAAYQDYVRVADE